MNVAALRVAMADTLRAAITTPAKIQVYPQMLAQPSLPCLMVPGLNEVEYHHTSQGGGDDRDSRWQFLVIGITGAGVGDKTSQDTIDAWISDSGASSVKDALEASSDGTYVGLQGVHDLIVRTSQGYGFYVVNGVEYLGCDWLVDVYTGD